VPSFNLNNFAHKCVSRKGKKIEKRILLGDDYDDDDDALIGETAFTEYPWMIELLKRNRKSESFEYKCGAVLSRFNKKVIRKSIKFLIFLVNSKSALTANHCLKGSNVKPENFIIRAGEWDRSSILEYAPHHDRALSQIIANPQYYSGGLHNDIAILRWIIPLPTEVNIAPICLPDETEYFAAGTYCTVTGWGKAADNAPTTDKLKFAKVPIVTSSTCQKQFQDNRLGRRFTLHSSFICAGGEVGIDSCTNDGGSPLICPRSDGSFVLAGLVSWGLECGQKDVPGAYTNIQSQLKWLNSHEIK
jgi:secreted trypsin-like serine protease